MARNWCLLILTLGLATLAVSLAYAQGGYDLSWSTIDGGGGTWSSAEGYSLGGTAGQPDAGLMMGGAYSLAGGFWGGAAVAAPENRSYLPLVVRNP